VRRAVARSAFRPRIEVCGIGAAAAAQVAEAALASKPLQRALVVGLCGFLVPGLRVGDAAIYRSVQSVQDEGVALDVDSGPFEELGTLLPSAHKVRAVQSGAIVALPSEKSALAERFDVQAVDMESFTLLERLRRGGVEVGVVRIGSDASDDELPDLSPALDASGRLSQVQLARIVVSRPAAALLLARNGLRALAALQRAVEQVCAQGPGAGAPKA
jgi:nucleoside phosphorylase